MRRITIGTTYVFTVELPKYSTTNKEELYQYRNICIFWIALIVLEILSEAKEANDVCFFVCHQQWSSKK